MSEFEPITILLLVSGDQEDRGVIAAFETREEAQVWLGASLLGGSELEGPFELEECELRREITEQPDVDPVGAPGSVRDDLGTLYVLRSVLESYGVDGARQTAAADEILEKLGQRVRAAAVQEPEALERVARQLAGQRGEALSAESWSSLDGRDQARAMRDAERAIAAFIDADGWDR